MKDEHTKLTDKAESISKDYILLSADEKNNLTEFIKTLIEIDKRLNVIHKK